MKRFLLAGVAVGALLGLAGSAQAADKKTLVFVVNGASDFWKAAEAGVKKAQGELPELQARLQISRTIVCGDPDPPDG